MIKFETLNAYQKTTIALQSIQALIGIIGIICNMLTFAVFLRKPLIKCSYAFYFRLICWADSIVLLHTFRHWLRVVLDVNIDLFGPLFCRFNEFQPYLLGSITLWLRILVLFDRFIRIIYPNHFRIIKAKSFQFIAVSVIFVYSALYHSIVPVYMRFEYVNSQENTVNKSTLACYLPPEILSLNFKLVLSNLALSILLTTLLDIKLILHIYSSRRRLQNRLYKPHSSIVKDRTFAISSMGVSLGNYLCLLTYSTSVMVAVNSKLDIDQLQAVFTGSLTVTICSNASVFFVNIIMNSIFYNEFLFLIGIKKI